jgi:ferredoxin
MSVRIVIDEDLCQGTKECAAIVPGLVTFDGVGIAQVDPTAPELSDQEAARLVATCPSMAISIADA